MTQHFYGDLSNLNAPYDTVPLQGYASLGADDPKYPWKARSADTLSLQQDLNEGLTSHGLCPLVEDGFMGPKTCGAVKYFQAQGVWSGDVPSTCAARNEYVAPGPCGTATTPSGGGSNTTPPVVTVQEGSLGGAIPGWAIGLGLGALAIGVALVMKKKKRR